mmetsp:Transcript_26633/g.71496  ORF Transcript_26633/g.71496 Transcript_26633/m.71496 type:complete len:711 (+) Transcript_26633:1576-3708(+)
MRMTSALSQSATSAAPRVQARWARNRTFYSGTLRRLSVSGTDSQYIGVWDTESGELLAEQQAPNGPKPAVRQIVCAPMTGSSMDHDYDTQEFVSVGNSSSAHFYRFCRSAVAGQRSAAQGGSGGARARRGAATERVPLDRRLGRTGQDNMLNLSVAYINDHAGRHRDASIALREDRNKMLVVTGGSNGHLYLWRDAVCLSTLAVDPGVQIHCLTYKAGTLWAGMSSGTIKKFAGATLHFAKTLCIDPDQRTAEVMKDQALEQQERFDAAARGGGDKHGKQVAATGLLSCLEDAFDLRWGGGGTGNQRPNQSRGASRGGGGGGRESAKSVSAVAGAPSRRAKNRITTHPRYGVRHMAVMGNHEQSLQIFLGTVKGQILSTTPSESDGRVFNEVLKCHTGSVNAVCAHAAIGDVYVTLGGEGDKKLLVWSAERKRAVKAVSMPGVGTCVTWGPSTVNALAVGFEDGSLRVYASTTFEEAAFRRDCQEQISCVKYSPDGKMLAAGNNSNNIDLYSVDRGYRPHKRLVGHTSYIKALDWSLDSAVIQSNCAACELLYWDADKGKQVQSDPAIEADGQWDTWTCSLGFPVMGIWQKDQDSTDINSVCRSYGERLVITADDEGFVRLMNSPALVNQPPCLSYRAHGSHITGVCFLIGDRYVVSAGGSDHAVIQWRVHRNEKFYKNVGRDVQENFKARADTNRKMARTRSYSSGSFN